MWFSIFVAHRSCIAVDTPRSSRLAINYIAYIALRIILQKGSLLR